MSFKDLDHVEYDTTPIDPAEDAWSPWPDEDLDEPKTPIATAKLSLFEEFPDIGDAFTTTDATDSNIYSRQYQNVSSAAPRHPYQFEDDAIPRPFMDWPIIQPGKQGTETEAHVEENEDWGKRQLRIRIRDAEARAQSAEDRMYILKYEVGEKQEQLEQTELITNVYVKEASDLSERVQQLEVELRARDEQIRILQYSLDQSVRAAIDGSEAPRISIHGPAALEYLRDINSTEASTGMLTDGGYTTGMESDTASDAASDAASEAGTERDTSDFDLDLDFDSASEYGGSFSDVSAPSDVPLTFGTPHSGSPGPPSTPGGMASGDDWSDVGGDTDMEAPSPPSSGAATPARAESPLGTNPTARAESSVNASGDVSSHVQTTTPSLWPTSKWSPTSNSRLQRNFKQGRKAKLMNAVDAQHSEAAKETLDVEHNPMSTDDHAPGLDLPHDGSDMEVLISHSDDDLVSVGMTTASSTSLKNVGTEPNRNLFPEASSSFIPPKAQSSTSAAESATLLGPEEEEYDHVSLSSAVDKGKQRAVEPSEV